MRTRGQILTLVLIILLSGCSLLNPINISPTPLATAMAVQSTSTPFPSPTYTLIPAPPTPKPPLVLKKGPYLLFTDVQDGMTVVWQGEPEGEYLFEWGVDETYTLGSSSHTADFSTALVQVRLSGLQPSTRYTYRVSTEKAEVRGSFVTPPPASDSLIFFAFGDTRSGPETHNEISARILNYIDIDPSAQTFVISTGDLMDTATEESLQENLFAADQPHIQELMSSLPVVNIMGNHDGTALFKQYFPYPFTQTYDWSFDYGPAHFVIIDQYIDLVEGSERWFWLKNDLSSTPKTWKFILLHEPGWSAGPHGNDEMVQSIIQPLAVAYGVQMVIAGHNHYYARAEVEGVTHVTTGGGGAPLYDPESGWPFVTAKMKAYHYIKFIIKGNSLTAQVLSPQGSLLDEFTLTSQEVP